MRTAFLGSVLATLALLTVSCGDIIVADPADVVTADTVTAPDTSTLVDIDTPSDLYTPPPGDVSRPDVNLTGLVSVTQEPEVYCEPWDGGYGGELKVTLQWETEEPTHCMLTMHVPGQEPMDTPLPDSAPQTTYTYEHSITALTFGETAPRLGDEVIWVAHCNTPDESLDGDSEPMVVGIDGSRLECVWPYDSNCSDGSQLICRVALPTCVPPRVPAVLDGCGHCVYPETCSCDDGTEPSCDMVPPECQEPLILATRENCYLCVNPWTCEEPDGVNCSDFITSRASCHFDLERANDEDSCEHTECRRGRCATDDDCSDPFSIGTELKCVHGNCVACSSNLSCMRGQVCRGGRCVGADEDRCPDQPTCDDGCTLLLMSDVPCPVCVCSSILANACGDADDCERGVTLEPFKACVYGHCAYCRNDKDCSDNQLCVHPGLCTKVVESVEQIFGLWLIGDIDSSSEKQFVSYFRFEPDGTLRRGRYEEEDGFFDEIPELPNQSDGVQAPGGLMGTWTANPSQTDGLEVALTLNHPDLANAGWTNTMFTSFDGDSIHLIGGALSWNGIRVMNPDEICSDDMRECLSPAYAVGSQL